MKTHDQRLESILKELEEVLEKRWAIMKTQSVHSPFFLFLFTLSNTFRCRSFTVKTAITDVAKRIVIDPKWTNYMHTMVEDVMAEITKNLAEYGLESVVNKASRSCALWSSVQTTCANVCSHYRQLVCHLSASWPISTPPPLQNKKAQGLRPSVSHVPRQNVSGSISEVRA